MKKTEEKETKHETTDYALPQKRIDELKRQHGEIHVITVKKGEESYRCVLKDPYAKDLTIVSRGMMIKEDLVKRSIFFLDNLWIEGHNAFKNDNKVRISGALQASGIVEVLEGQSVKY